MTLSFRRVAACALLVFLFAILGTTSVEAATIPVNDASDTIHNSLPTDCAQSGTGTCSLRDAILFANANGPGPHTVTFAGLPASTITLSALNGGLPAITVPMNINGTTYPGGRVEISGAALAGAPNGLTLNASCTISGLVINGFGGDGISVGGSGGSSTITGNYIGTNALGTSASANHINGITVNAPTVTINSNVISGNLGTGLEISGLFTVAVNVQNNKIGTNALGTGAIGNGFHGIRVRSAASGAIIGGGNVISGNTGHGIFLDGSASAPTANIISGNFIGTRIAGLGSLANTQDGIRIDNSNANVIGAAGFANIISGNTGNGISVHSSDQNQIFANLIGVDATALVALGDGNGLDGILIDGSTNTTVGGIGGALTRNVISANTGAGVHISGSVNTTGNVVEGNFIGTNIDGGDSNQLPNGTGIFVEGSNTSNNTIGGSTASRANTIAWNTNLGIRIGATASDFVGNTAILTNSIHDNGGLGIDLGNNGVTPNDAGDVDSGPNGFQNFPVIANALVSTATGKIVLLGTQDSAAASNELQFFLADSAALANGEGKTLLLDQTSVPNGSFLIGPSTPAVAVAAGNVATATATTTDGTSEFAANVAFAANVIPTASAGPNQSVATGATVVLDGSASADSDALPLGSTTIASGNFTWSQTGGPAVVLTGGTTSTPSFVAATPGSYVFSLVVSDGMDLSTNPASVTITVNSASTTAVISSANPSVAGQPVTFTATVTGAGPTPTGTVTFKDGLTTLGTGTLNGSAQATFLTSALSVGGHTITGVYGGDSNFISSISPDLVQTVNAASTTTAVVSSVNPSVFGQSVTFTATVSVTAPGAGTPTGNASFFDGATLLGAVALNGSAQAAFSTGALTVGSHSITVVYAGDANYLTSTSPILTQNVNAASTTTAVISSANPTVFGQSVTFTATVAVTVPGAGTPTGNASFFDGATLLGAVALNGSAQAAFSTSALTVGSHSITAVYAGDSSFNTSTSAVLSQVVNMANTTTVVVSSANPSVVAQSVTFTATVTATAPGGGIPTGNASFFDGITPLGTVALDGSGQAAFSTSALTAGSHSITASYGGSASYNTSTSGVLTQVVNTSLGTASSTALASSVNPSVFGQSVTFTATVTGGVPVATGTITFKDGVTTLGSGGLNGAGQAAFSTSALTVGSHSITAVYGGDPTYAASTSPIVTQVVNQAATTTAVVSSVNPSTVGQSVTFTATVTATAPGSGTPTGNVSFFDGVTPLGTTALNGSGQAAFSTAALTLGSHAITASYAGSASNSTSTSGILTQVVNAALGTPSATALASSVNPSVFGQSVTFTASVTGGVPVATGTVTFKDGATTLGSGALNGAGQATFSTAALTVGSHSITASYGGDLTYAPSASPAVSQVVNQAGTTTTLASSLNPSNAGQSVTFTATVAVSAPGVGVPTGTVTFFDGASSLGTGALNGAGQATLSTSALTAGSHSITASYAGDANFITSTSAVLTQVVNGVVLSPSTTAVVSSLNPSPVGSPVTFTATVTGGGPVPTGTVTFRDGATVLGTAGLNSAGQATFTTSALTIGSHTIAADYGGDATYSSSGNQLTQIVGVTGVPFLDGRALAALALVLALAGAFVMRKP